MATTMMKMKTDPVVRVRRSWLRKWRVLAGDCGLILGCLEDGRGVATDSYAMRVHDESEKGFAEVFGDMPPGTARWLRKGAYNMPEVQDMDRGVGFLAKILELDAEWLTVDESLTAIGDDGNGGTYVRLHAADGALIVCNQRLIERAYRAGEQVQAQRDGEQRQLRVLDAAGRVVGVFMPMKCHGLGHVEWVQVGRFV